MSSGSDGGAEEASDASDASSVLSNSDEERAVREALAARQPLTALAPAAADDSDEWDDDEGNGNGTAEKSGAGHEGHITGSDDPYCL